MKTTLLISPFFTFFFLSLTLSAQKSTEVDHQIQSIAFDTERNIRVFLPERYYRDTSQEFIVTYVLDAQSDDLWNMAKGNIGYLVRQYQVIPMIAVGIVSENRGNEFSPNSPKLSEHLRKEVIPLIEKEYRVNDFRIIIGHSWGGAFIGNTLFSEQSDLFDAYIGISPSLGAIDGRIFRQADSLLQTQKPFGKYLYCSSGDFGIRELESRQEVLEMDSIIRRSPHPTLQWEYEVFEGTDHWSCVIPSINHGLIKVSRNYFADGQVVKELATIQKEGIKKEIAAFYRKQNDLFGFTFHPSARYWEFIADDFRQLEQWDVAKDLYLMSIEGGNERVACYFNLASTFEGMGDISNTIAYLKRTDTQADKQKENISDGFYTSIKKEVKERLEKYDK